MNSYGSAHVAELVSAVSGGCTALCFATFVVHVPETERGEGGGCLAREYSELGVPAGSGYTPSDYYATVVIPVGERCPSIALQPEAGADRRSGSVESQPRRDYRRDWLDGISGELTIGGANVQLGRALWSGFAWRVDFGGTIRGDDGVWEDCPCGVEGQGCAGRRPGGIGKLCGVEETEWAGTGQGRSTGGQRFVHGPGAAASLDTPLPAASQQSYVKALLQLLGSGTSGEGFGPEGLRPQPPKALRCVDPQSDQRNVLGCGTDEDWYDLLAAEPYSIYRPCRATVPSHGLQVRSARGRAIPGGSR